MTDQPRPSAPDGDDQASLLKVVRKAARRPDAPIDGAMLLRRDLRLNDAGMAYLKYLVDKELLQKTTSSEAWKDVRTVEELTAFVRRQR